MARSRFIKPDFFDDPVLARCSHPARLLFAATWQLADRLGIFEWDESKLRKYAFGYDDITGSDVRKMLDELLRHGFIKVGEYRGRLYGFVVNLAKHQKFHVAEKSRFEEVAAGILWTSASSSTLPAPCQHPADTVPESLSLFPVPLRPSLENGELSVVNREVEKTDLGGQNTRSLVIDTWSRTRKTKALEPLVLADFRRIAATYDRPTPGNFDDDDARAAGKIYAKYPQGYQTVFVTYFADEFYGRYGWSIQNLARNLDQIANRKPEEPFDESKINF